MRSVKKARTQRSDGRRKSDRRNARPSRPAAVAGGTFGRRRRSDPFSLLIARIHRWFATGRPMLWLTGLVLLCVLVTGVFAGGHVRRVFGMAVGRALDTVVADAGFGISAVQLSGNHRTQAG